MGLAVRIAENECLRKGWHISSQSVNHQKAKLTMQWKQLRSPPRPHLDLLRSLLVLVPSRSRPVTINCRSLQWVPRDSRTLGESTLGPRCHRREWILA